ncbi:hypothetical protein TRM7557_01958 [Tritonibacter multivorans]|uniref:Uncharacterized protein n=1 Tax=Tritonibacter multivorans TaxID=928856 RepID=A0A0P1GTW1_9RHOB|nr:hypothetical protein TRM7557_01958 [Tritonibacter multivorans]
MAVACVGVDNGQRANGRACGVFSDGGAVQHDLGRGLIHVLDGDGEGLGGREPACVGDGDLQIDLSGLFVVEADAILQADLIADDLEAVVREGDLVAVACVGVDN